MAFLADRKFKKNSHLLGFFIHWNLQNKKNQTYDMTVQGQLITVTCVLWRHIARASSNFKMK